MKEGKQSKVDNVLTSSRVGKRGRKERENQREAEREGSDRRRDRGRRRWRGGLGHSKNSRETASI